MTTMIKPTKISIDKEKREMTVVWADGHVSVYSFTLLRNACPCAECSGGHENMRHDPDPIVFTLPDEDTPRTHLKDAVLVGNYGINLIWEDGHHYGIYNWDYLRKLCPCEECMSKRPPIDPNRKPPKPRKKALSGGFYLDL